MADMFFIAQQTPRIDGMYWIMLASRILHILSAVVLVGGLFYLRSVITPAAMPFPAGEGRGDAVDRLFGGRRATWAMWVGIASLLLLVTGLWNFVSMIMQNQLHWSYHMLGAVKIVLGLVLMGIAALLAWRSAAAESVRNKLRLWLNVALLLGIVVIIVGSVMRTFPRTLKPDAPGPSEVIAVMQDGASVQPATND